MTPSGPHAPPHGFWTRWRGNFLTGVVVIAPLYLTVWLTWSAVSLVDAKVERILPEAWSLGWLGVPGWGLAIFVVFTALMGALAKNLFAAQAIRWGERMLARLPVVRSLYNGIKQIAETVLVQSKSAFQKACLVEFPRKGAWSVAFVCGDARGELARRMPGLDLVAVFVPTTPNPTSGYLMYVDRAEIVELDMSIEEAAKLIISGGLVTPDDARASRLSAAAE